MKTKSILVSLALGCSYQMYAQNTPPKPEQNKGTFIEYKNGFLQDFILKGIKEFEEKATKPEPKLTFKVDLSNVDYPKSVDEFTKQWCNEPVSQGNTGTCWCFSTSSFIETEIFRQTKQQVKISQMYTVYWEYVEKARRFIQERGNSNFGEGSEADAVTRMMKMYGAVPQKDYTGLKPEQNYYNHSVMFAEMDNYLKSVKAANAWNEEEALSTIKSILKHYIGVPPTSVTIDGKTMTPLDYMYKVLKFNPDDYVNIFSLMQKPYYKKVEYEVPDNWWHSAEYYNVPLDEWMTILKNVLKNNYTVAIGGDISEAGFVNTSQVAIVPSFDIPAEYIDENARQFRFSNTSTTDDHGMHIVGYMEKNGTGWFLVKDSGSGSRNSGRNVGYYFFREDYVKLKMMDFFVHKDAVKELLKKF